MADIAQAVGCSTMTVSLALRESPRVSAEKRQTIREMAEKMGYRPNPLVSALMMSRRKPTRERETLALFSKFDDRIESWQDYHPFYTDLYEGIAERADELGFRVEEFATHLPGAPSGDRLTMILRTRGIRGIILFPGGGLDRDYPECRWEHFATVAASFHARQMRVHRTATDYALGMNACLEELVRRGYRRIGFAVSRVLDPEVSYAESGRYLSWREQQPTRYRVPLVPGDSIRPGKDEFLAWFEKYKPECVLAPHANAPRWLKNAGYHVPNDVGVVAVPLRDAKNHAGLDARTHDVGRMTVSVLARELFLNHYGLPSVPEASYIAGTWRDGPTVRPSLD